MLTQHIVTYRGIERGRSIEQPYRVWRLDAPTPATWEGHPVVIVALDWDARGVCQQAVFASGMRVPMGEIRQW